MSEFKFEVLKKHCVLSVSANGWTTELRTVSWNGREEKYDIREWAPNDEKMSKGLTFEKDELKKLKDALDGIFSKSEVN